MIEGLAFAAKVSSHEIWSATGIILKKDTRYSIAATGSWVDWFVPCDADGYRLWLLSHLDGQKRVPDQNWFKLMGSIDRDEECVFPIGTRAVITAPADGELTCFANDLKSMYWNNWGSVDVAVSVLKQDAF